MVILLAEQHDGEICDSKGNHIDLLDTFIYLSETEGVDTVPKLFFMHIYNTGGKIFLSLNPLVYFRGSITHSSMVDEDYSPGLD